MKLFQSNQEWYILQNLPWVRTKITTELDSITRDRCTFPTVLISKNGHVTKSCIMFIDVEFATCCLLYSSIGAPINKYLEVLSAQIHFVYKASRYEV